MDFLWNQIEAMQQMLILFIVTVTIELVSECYSVAGWPNISYPNNFGNPKRTFDSGKVLESVSVRWWPFSVHLWWAYAPATWCSAVQLWAGLSRQPANGDCSGRHVWSLSYSQRPLNGIYSTNLDISCFYINIWKLELVSQLLWSSRCVRLLSLSRSESIVCWYYVTVC